MRRLTPEAVFRSGQAIHYDFIKTMVEHYGFKVREGNGTSHVTVIHEDYPDLKFSLNRSAGRELRYQKEAAKACMEVTTRAAALEIEIDSFDSKQKPLPEDILLKTKENTLILRHQEFPCIGIAIGYDPEKNGISDIAHRRAPTLREKAKELSSLLEKAQKDFDINVTRDGEKIILDYPFLLDDGNSSDILPPFDLLSETDPIAIVKSAIEIAEKDMITCKRFFEEMQKKDEITALSIDTNSETPNVCVSVKNLVTGGIKVFSRPVTKNAVIRHDDQLSLIFDIYSHLFEAGTFKTLQVRFGIKARHKDGAKMILENPVLGMSEDMPNPRHILSRVAQGLSKNPLGPTLETGEPDLEWIAEVQEAWARTCSFGALVLEQIKPTSSRVDKINLRLQKLGVNITLAKKIKVGELNRLTFEHIDSGDRISTDVVRVSPGQKQNTLALRFNDKPVEYDLISSDGLSQLEAFVTKHEQKLSPTKKTGVPLIAAYSQGASGSATKRDPIAAAVAHIVHSSGPISEM